MLFRRDEKERYMRLAVAPEVLVFLFSSSEPILWQITEHPLPADARCAGVTFNKHQTRFELILYSETFHVVHPGQEPPLLEAPTVKVGKRRSDAKCGGETRSPTGHEKSVATENRDETAIAVPNG